MWREALAVAFAVSVRGCGPGCPDAQHGVLPPIARVEVFDAVTAAPICDATVTLVAGNYQEVLEQGWNGEAGVPPEGGAACPYRGGNWVDPAEFTLIASAPGYQTDRKQLAIGTLVCGVHETRNVTFKLQPQ